MRAGLVSTLMLLGLAGTAVAQTPPPPGHPPHLWLASASRQETKVVIQIARAWPKASRPARNAAADTMIWDDLRPVTLGHSVQAYGVDGKPLEAAAVLKTLARPRAVAVFVRIYSFDPPQPPPFYLDLLREGTIVLVAEGKDLYPLEP